MIRPSLNRRCWLPVLVCLLASCAATPPAPSRTEAAAIEFNRDGQAAWQHGEYRQAQAAFEAALAIDLADENTDGAAINLLNLSRLEQLQGHPSAAHQQLERLLAILHRAGPAHWQIAAAVRQAQLYLGEDNAKQAADWARQAADGCQAKCSEQATIFNVQAAIALRQRDDSRAEAFAQAALSHSQGTSQRNEHANALRLLGEIALRQQRGAAAQPLLSAALALDKVLGLPVRIHRDLQLLQQAALQCGQRAQAEVFQQRARQVEQGLARMPPELKADAS